jgi:hypothetical protein
MLVLCATVHAEERAVHQFPRDDNIDTVESPHCDTRVIDVVVDRLFEDVDNALYLCLARNPRVQWV